MRSWCMRRPHNNAIYNTYRILPCQKILGSFLPSKVMGWLICGSVNLPSAVTVMAMPVEFARSCCICTYHLGLNLTEWAVNGLSLCAICETWYHMTGLRGGQYNALLTAKFDGCVGVRHLPHGACLVRHWSHHQLYKCLTGRWLCCIVCTSCNTKGLFTTC